MQLPAGALIPSVDDCLDRLYTELVPAEDVTRMRVRLVGSSDRNVHPSSGPLIRGCEMLDQPRMFSRFAKSGFELSKDDLPEVLSRSVADVKSAAMSCSCEFDREESARNIALGTFTVLVFRVRVFSECRVAGPTRQSSAGVSQINPPAMGSGAHLHHFESLAPLVPPLAAVAPRGCGMELLSG